MPIEGFNFDEAMAAQSGVGIKVEENGRVKVRFFTNDGIAQVEQLLKKIRLDKEMYKDEVEELVNDPEYTKQVPAPYLIDPERKFKTKKDLCEYFVPLFGFEFLEANRKNAGLWTWLALVYYNQFVKTVKGAVKLSSNARWIFDHNNYRLSVRHIVAGPIYLYQDFLATSEEVKDMLFFSDPKEFGGFIDAITYKMEGTRIPALMQAAAALYYDPTSPKKVKKGVTSQDRPGTVRELLRVASQLAQTRDFYGVNDTEELLRILPPQFDRFKNLVVVQR